MLGSHFETIDVNNSQGAAYESGLDNSPMYDDIPFDAENHLMCLWDVGLNGLYVADCQALAELAAVIGRAAKAEELSRRGAAYSVCLATLWDERTGLFLSRRTDTGEFSPCISPTHFYPLIGKVTTPEQAARKITEHFYNPEEFWAS